MALKPDAQDWKIKEQIVEDLPTGLTLQFRTVDDSTAPFRLVITGDFPFGNREIIFDETGKAAGGGTHTTQQPRPSWLREV